MALEQWIRRIPNLLLMAGWVCEKHEKKPAGCEMDSSLFNVYDKEGIACIQPLAIQHAQGEHLAADRDLASSRSMIACRAV